MKSGWNINLSVAIDFTASNKDPTEPDSLHRIDPDDPDFQNEYEYVMEHVGSILEPYAFQSKFLGYGFGGIPTYMGETEVSHCFNLTGTKNPKIDGLKNLIKMYKERLQEIELYGPTFFTEIVGKVIELCHSTNK